MIIKKVGVLILVIIISLSIVLGLSLELTTNKISPGDKFFGTVNFNVENYVDYNENLVVKVNDKEYTKTISEIFENKQNKNILLSNYSVAGQPSSSLLINLDSNKKFVGFDLSEGAVFDFDTLAIGEIRALNFVLNGEQRSNVFPKDIQIDIGNDGAVDYSYKGVESLGFQEVETPFNREERNPSTVELAGANSDTYCQAIEVGSSKNYKISAYTKKIGEGAQLKAMINSEIPDVVDCEEAGNCCNLNSGNTLSWNECIVNVDIPEKKEVYACISVFNGDFSETYYELGKSSGDEVKKGYRNNMGVPLNYFINAKWEKFSTELRGPTEDIGIPVEIITDFLFNNEECNNCLLIPLKIESNTEGNLRIENIRLSYDTAAGRTTLRQVVPLNYLPKRITYNNTLKVQLSDIKNLTAPLREGSYQLSASIEGMGTSEQINFEVKKGPLVQIRSSNPNPAAGEEVNFGVIVKTLINNKEIKDYYWDFGDETKERTASPSHVYNKTGAYDVNLIVVDRNGLSGRTEYAIEVSQTSTSLSDQLNRTLNSIDLTKASFDSYPADIKEVVRILSLDTLLDTSRLGVIKLMSDYENSTRILIEEQKITRQDLIKTELGELKSKLPVNVKINTLQFSSVISAISEIPEASSLGYSDVEDFKLKAFSYQQNLDIKTESKLVEITYQDGSQDSFVLVKKTIPISGNTFEIPGLNVLVNRFITNYSIVSQGIYKFKDVSEIFYVLDSADTSVALSTKTIVLPDDPSSIEVGTTKTESESGTFGRESVNKGYGVLLLVLALILAGAIVYYYQFYKKPQIFNSEKDKMNLKNYIKTSLSKDIKKDQIAKILKQKNWNDKQIKIAMNEVITELKSKK